MPKRTDIKSILVIGAGPIVIGQACEFDYSGVQAIKALKSEGYRVILVNSNPATIMTDPELADATYIEPITPEMVAKIIAKEKPDALLPTMGGQTALNCALKLEQMGVLKEHGVEMIGARAEAIEKAEDRKKFREAMDRIGLDSPRSAIVASPELSNVDGKVVYDLKAGFIEAMKQMEIVGLPCIVRPAFTLGGLGGGVAYNRQEFEDIVTRGLQMSPVSQVLIDESLLGWKEFEMEVVRDKADNCIIICSIENVDPMGVHTGDSITVAPALTLTDREYQVMRNASIAVLREIGVETGGSNVQFAVNPDDGRLVVIEMNPRVSRSSALASKATGFPIAKVAAKLAIGYTLDELDNDITGVTPASFEPTIDYVVVKIPRFAFEKYKSADPALNYQIQTLTTQMKSVGEAMAIGRTFQESLQKALRSLETGISGFDEQEIPGGDRSSLIASISRPTEKRLLNVAQAFREGLTVDEVHSASKIDKWFLRQIAEIIAEEARIKANGLPKTADECDTLKAMGFSDVRLAKLGRQDRAEVARRAARWRAPGLQAHRHLRGRVRIAKTPYMYSTYETGRSPARRPAECEADRARAARPSSWAAAQPHRPGHRVRLLLLPRLPSRCMTSASKPSWSTATRRRCRPTTTRPTASISSR
jgi:carbamoyl-phosphate synthase large subunit